VQRRVSSGAGVAGSPSCGPCASSVTLDSGSRDAPAARATSEPAADSSPTECAASTSSRDLGAYSTAACYPAAPATTSLSCYPRSGSISSSVLGSSDSVNPRRRQSVRATATGPGRCAACSQSRAPSIRRTTRDRCRFRSAARSSTTGRVDLCPGKSSGPSCSPR
jgi:hypothetical protein